MESLMWIAFGMIVGLITNLIYPSNKTFMGTIMLGGLGGLLGGFLATVFSNSISGFSLPSIILAGFGTMILIGMQRGLLVKKEISEFKQNLS